MIEYVVESGSQVSDQVVPKGASRRVLKEPCDARGVHCGLERSKGSGEGDLAQRCVSVRMGVCVCAWVCLLLRRTCCGARE